MKLFLEIVLSLVLHPISAILMWIDVLGRDDINVPQKILWMLCGVLWGIGPILYILVGGGTLW